MMKYFQSQNGLDICFGPRDVLCTAAELAQVLLRSDGLTCRVRILELKIPALEGIHVLVGQLAHCI